MAGNGPRIAVIVLAVLALCAAVALPLYDKLQESEKWTPGRAKLEEVRNAMLRYAAASGNNTLPGLPAGTSPLEDIAGKLQLDTASFASLAHFALGDFKVDVSNPGSGDGTTSPQFVISVKPSKPGAPSGQMTIDQNGTLTGP